MSTYASVDDLAGTHGETFAEIYRVVCDIAQSRGCGEWIDVASSDGTKERKFCVDLQADEIRPWLDEALALWRAGEEDAALRMCADYWRNLMFYGDGRGPMGVLDTPYAQQGGQDA